MLLRVVVVEAVDADAADAADDDGSKWIVGRRKTTWRSAVVHQKSRRADAAFRHEGEKSAEQNAGACERQRRRAFVVPVRFFVVGVVVVEEEEEEEEEKDGDMGLI
jgi:hypothetical protein